jgi:hypothetical protein
MTKHVSRATLAALALGAGLAFAAPANADADSYLAWLQNHGVVGSGSGQYSPSFLLQTGNDECAALQEGRSEQFLIGQLYTQMGRAPAQDIVYAAHHYLCPGA